MECDNPSCSPSAPHVYAVHVPNSDDWDDPGTSVQLFSSLKEASKYASTPLLKAKGARIKRFTNVVEAEHFVRGGSPAVLTKYPIGGVVASEPSVAFPSVSRVEMNRLKRAIEMRDDKLFDSLVNANPRFLINTSGDVPTVLVEGTRYNALHIAARVGNEHVARSVLDLVTDEEQLKRVYGEACGDVNARSAFLLDAYLNTPDKGANETPLHFAAKHGHIAIVKLLFAYQDCHRHPRNRNGDTPQSLICSREGGDDVRMALQALFGDIYIGLYRPLDNSQSAIIAVPSAQYPSPSLQPTGLSDGPLQSPVVSDMRLAAVAGPFLTQMAAEMFRRQWQTTDREIRLTDMHKGFERVGRRLAAQSGIGWSEYWHFMDTILNLESAHDLALLDRYLRSVNRRHSPIRRPSITECRKSSIPECKRARIEEAEEEDFEDAVDQLSTNLPRQTSLEDVQVEEDDRFVTPPSTPPPVFVSGAESKTDVDLVLALSQMDTDKLNRYPAIERYLAKISMVPMENRRTWPSHDSPRASSQMRLSRFHKK